MTCKDCVHYEVCCSWAAHRFVEDSFESCTHFKPKSRFVELPCEVGSTVYSISPVLYIGLSFNEFVKKKANGELVKVYETEATLPEIAEWITPDCFGRIKWGTQVFLSREEAEKALAERSK